MIVSFQTKELLVVCSNLEAAEKRLGPELARILTVQLADVEAADHAGELLDLLADGAEIVGENSVVLWVGKDHRATFVPVGTFGRREPNGTPDWPTVRRLKLMDIAQCP